MTTTHKHTLVLLALLSPLAWAQNQAYLQQGAGFAKSLAPTSNTQLVNPNGVNSSAWGGYSTIAPAVPSGMGAFSAPITDTNVFNQAKGLGLTGLGVSALDRCANYKPTGDPAKDQECAAVNFMAQKCLRPNAGQQSVLGNLGTHQSLADNCEGSYGQGQQRFDYTNRVTRLDPAFSTSSKALENPGGAAEQSCSVTTEVTEPAKFSTYQCSEYRSSEELRCSQTLAASVQTSHAPPSKLSYDCPIPSGSGDLGTGPVSFAEMTMANYLRYGHDVCYYFIRGNVNYNGYLSALESQFNMHAISWNQDYGRFELATTARTIYTCPDGSLPTQGLCVERTLHKAWNDACTALEFSAGVHLETP